MFYQHPQQFGLLGQVPDQPTTGMNLQLLDCKQGNLIHQIDCFLHVRVSSDWGEVYLREKHCNHFVTQEVLLTACQIST